MASKSKRARIAPQRNLAKTFLYWAITIFVIKLIIIASIPASNFDILAKPYNIDGAWLGADGENYLSGFEFLSRDGIFSKESILSYWPAGYPLFLLLLSFLGKSWMLSTLSIFQSLLFSFSTYFFASQLVKTKFRKYAYLVFLLILLNPTLSLSSLSVGYESIAASGLLLILGLLIQDLTNPKSNIFTRNIIFASLTVAFISFLQPRLLLSGLIGLSIWVFVRKPFKIAVLVTLVSIVVVAVSPSLLILRNQKANGFSAISTNLGVTMNLGAGDKADGSFKPKGDYGVPCTSIEGNAAVQDNHLTKCVISWYLNHPLKSVELFANKARFFWSPWSGPEAVGSMARNPWFKINPMVNIASTSKAGNDLINGLTGRIISWLWLIGSFLLLLFGFWQLWKEKGIERVVALFAATQIGLNWLIAIATLGDHRQRLPILGLSLFLQAVGIRTVFKGKKNILAEGQNLPSKGSADTALSV